MTPRLVLDWRTVTPSNDPRHMRRGTELDSAVVPGTCSRFVIYSVRRFVENPDWERHKGFQGRFFSDARYHVRDADTVSDADVREGKRPAVVFEADTLDEVEAWIYEIVRPVPRAGQPRAV